MPNTPSHTPVATWVQRGTTALLAGLALGGMAFWAMQIMALGRPDPQARFVSEPEQAVDRASWGRLLGGSDMPAATPEPVKSTLTLVAVIARGAHAGSAMISINGQKALPYQPGDEVQTGRHVVELGLRRVGLGPSPQGPVVEVLELKVPRLPE